MFVDAKKTFSDQIFKIDISDSVGVRGLCWLKWDIHIEIFRGRTVVIKYTNKCLLQSLPVDQEEEGAKGNK